MELFGKNSPQNNQKILLQKNMKKWCNKIVTFKYASGISSSKIKNKYFKD